MRSDRQRVREAGLKREVETIAGSINLAWGSLANQKDQKARFALFERISSVLIDQTSAVKCRRVFEVKSIAYLS